MSYRHIALAATLACAACGPSVAADKPSEAEVKKMIANIDKNALANFTFHSVQMAAPRKASAGESGLGGLPANVTIIPTRADYVENISGWVRDHRQAYYIYKDDFGGWTIQMTSDPYNFTSEPHRP